MIRRKQPRHTHRKKSTRGFTLVELLVVMAIALSLMLMVGLPLLNTLDARKLDGFARQTTVLLRKARLESIGNNVPTIVVIDIDRGEVLAFGDVHDSAGEQLRPDFAFTPVGGLLGKDTDYQITRLRLPGGVEFSAPAGHDVFSGFTTKRPSYNSDGIEVAAWLPDGSDLGGGGLSGGLEGGIAAAFWSADGGGDSYGTIETWAWEEDTSSGDFNIDRPRVVFSSTGSVRTTGWVRVGDNDDNYLEIRIEPAATGRVRLRKWDRNSDEWRYQGQGGEAWEWY